MKDSPIIDQTIHTKAQLLYTYMYGVYTSPFLGL